MSAPRITVEGCEELLKVLQGLARARTRLARVNAIQKDVLECDVLLPGGPGIHSERVSIGMPKGFMQQSLINQIRRLEATIRACGVEPPSA